MRVTIIAFAIALAAVSGLSCDIVVGGSHTVETVEEYVDYVEGADLHARHRVGILSFSCGQIRDGWVERMQEEFDRIVESDNLFVSIYFSRDGSTLRLSRASPTRVIRQPEFDAWEVEVQRSLADAREGRAEDPYTDALIRLFDKVELRAPDLAADFDIDFPERCRGGEDHDA